MKKHLCLSVPLIAILIFTIFSYSQMPILIVYGSPEDDMGNDVVYVEIWQYNGSSWNLQANFTNEGQGKLNDNQQVRFLIMIKYNSTLASSENEAIQNTKVLMNITYNSNFVWQNTELNNTSCILADNFYWLKEEGNWTTNLPQQAITYNAKILYQSYW